MPPLVPLSLTPLLFLGCRSLHLKAFSFCDGDGARVEGEEEAVGEPDFSDALLEALWSLAAA